VSSFLSGRAVAGEMVTTTTLTSVKVVRKQRPD